MALRESPGAKPSNSHGPTARRITRSAGYPSAAVMRRTRSVRPSASVREIQWVGTRSRSRMEVCAGQTGGELRRLTTASGVSTPSSRTPSASCWRASSVGPGAKAGGPNYVAELGRWSDAPEVPADDTGWLAWAAADDSRWWQDEFGVEHDPSGLAVESNVLRYRPVPGLVVRVGADALERDVSRVLAAAERASVPVVVSRVAERDDATFAAQVRDGVVGGRIRVIGTAPGLRAAARTRVGEVTVLDGPVLASGRRELLTVLREQAISRTTHRFGHTSESPVLRRAAQPSQNASEEVVRQRGCR